MIDIPKDVLKKIGNSIEAGPLEKVEEKDRDACYGCTGSCSASCGGCCYGCCLNSCADENYGTCDDNPLGLYWLSKKTDEGDTEKK